MPRRTSPSWARSDRGWALFLFLHFGPLCKKEVKLETRIGVVAIVIGDRLTAAPKVNEVLGQHAEIVVGRMGVPYRDRNISVIALIVDGTTDELGAMTGKLGRIPGVRVKTAIAT